MKKYEKYKDSGIKWIGEIPEHWEISTIGRIAKLGRGRVINVFEMKENPGKYPVYSSQTKNDGIMGYLGTYDFEGEYVTWTTDGANAGTVSYRKGKFNCTNVCGTIQPINPKKIHLKYLPYFLNLGTKFSVRLDINPKLMNNMMAKIPVFIPSFQEQTAIANYLDRKTAQIDELIADKKRLLELYEEEKTAIINQTVTKGIPPDVKMKDSGIEWLGEIPEHWEVIKFNHYVFLRHGYQFRDFDFTDTGIKVIKITQLKPNGELETEKVSFIDKNRLNEFKDIIINEGDILMALTGGTIGKIIRVGKVNEPLLQNYRVGNFFPSNNKLDKSFLFWVLSSNLILLQIFFDQRETGQPNIGKEDFGRMIFLLPLIEEQTAIVDYIEKEINRINAKAKKTKKLIELLKEYKQALISEVVTGKVKVI